MDATLNEIVWPTVLGTALGLAFAAAARRGVFARVRRLFA